MWTINPLHRNVLIMADEVLFHAPTAHTTDVRMIEQAIIIAEERFIKKALCKDFYEDFRNQKNIIVTDANIETLKVKSEIDLKSDDRLNAIELVDDMWVKKLWFEYLWKICAECVIYVATPTNYSEYTAQGEMINNPQSAVGGDGAKSATQKEVQWKMDKLLFDRIDPLLAAMHEWLCDNKAHFTLYNCKPCKCNEDGVSHKRKSGWINAYDDYNNNDSCRDD